MKDTLVPGMSMTKRIVVDKDRTVDFMGDELRVYGTPWMLKDMEVTCRNLIQDHLDAGQQSAGTHVNLDHVGACLLGSWVDITATVTGIDRRSVSFEVEACDALDVIGRATHTRFILDLDKQKQRLQQKAEKLKALT